MGRGVIFMRGAPNDLRGIAGVLTRGRVSVCNFNYFSTPRFTGFHVMYSGPRETSRVVTRRKCVAHVARTVLMSLRSRVNKLSGLLDIVNSDGMGLRCVCAFFRENLGIPMTVVRYRSLLITRDILHGGKFRILGHLMSPSKRTRTWSVTWGKRAKVGCHVFVMRSSRAVTGLLGGRLDS